LSRTIPSISNASQRSPAITKLKQQLGQLQQVLDKRGELIKTFREMGKGDDFDVKLTDLATKAAKIEYESLFKTELQKYSSLITQAEENLKLQDGYIKSITVRLFALCCSS
jgi:hypothetical protein